VIPSLLLWTISFRPPTELCDGSPLLHPEQIRYQVPYQVRAMVPYTDGGCLVGEDGQRQECAVVLSRGVWDVGAETSATLEDFLEPPPGAVFLFGCPLAYNDFGSCPAQACAP
jgi:hypothetical protein